MLNVTLATQSFEYVNGMKGQNLAIYLLRLWAKRDPELARAVNLSVVESWQRQGREQGNSFVDQVLATEPDVLALSCYLWNTKLLLGHAEKTCEALPELHVVLGGPDVGARAERLLGRHPFVTAVALGEGEETFRLLLRRLAGLDDDDWRETPGLAARRDGQIVQNPLLPPLDIDELPTTLDDPQLNTGSQLYIELGRGCKFRCSYCQYNSLQRRVRSPERVREELQRFSEMGGGVVLPLDSALNQERGRLSLVVGEMTRFPNLFLDGAEIKVDLLSSDEVAQLSKVCSHVAVGLQTTHQPTSRNIQRRYDPQRFAAGCAALREHGISFNIDIIYGLPGDSYQTFKQSMADAFALAPLYISPHHLQVLPGSPLARDAETYGLVYDEEPPYYLSYCTSFSVEDMVRAHRLAYANNLAHTFCRDSRPLQRTAALLRCEPTDLLEGLLSGEWRGSRPLSEEELQHFGEHQGEDDFAQMIRSWIDHACATSSHGPDELPGDLADDWNILLAATSLTATYDAGADREPPDAPVLMTTRLYRSPNARLLKLKEPRVEPDASADSPVRAHLLLVMRSTGLQDLELTDLVASLLAGLDQPTSVDGLLDTLPSDQAADLRGTDRQELLDVLGLLVGFGALNHE